MNPKMMQVKDVPPADMRPMALSWLLDHLHQGVPKTEPDMEALSELRCCDLTPHQALQVALVYKDGLGQKEQAVFVDDLVREQTRRTKLQLRAVEEADDDAPEQLVLLLRAAGGVLNAIVSEVRAGGELAKDRVEAALAVLDQVNECVGGVTVDAQVDGDGVNVDLKAPDEPQNTTPDPAPEPIDDGRPPEGNDTPSEPVLSDPSDTGEKGGGNDAEVTPEPAEQSAGGEDTV